MINISEVIETNKMIEQENFDVRTITMGINLLDCASTDLDELCQNIHNKITRLAKNLVKTRRRNLQGVWCTYRQQAYLHHSNLAGRRFCLQDYRRLREDCQDPRPVCQGTRHQLPGRLFCHRKQGYEQER